MTVQLTVRQVRDALFQQAAGSPPPGPNGSVRASTSDSARGSTSNSAPGGSAGGSTRLLGTLFHQVFAELVDSGGEHHWLDALSEERPDVDAWREALRRHAYRRLAGPRLARHQAALQESSEQVCLFWEAIVELCHWICDLVWEVREARGRLPQRDELVQCERSLELELRRPDWSDTVRLTGSADAVWQVPGKTTWCVSELKLGRGHDEADLAQACLYHLMLQRESPPASDPPRGTLALVNFRPRREEKLLAAEQLEETQARLLDLIGRLAGVAEPASESETGPPETASGPAAAGEAGAGEAGAGEAGAGEAGAGDATRAKSAAIPSERLLLPEPTEDHRALGEALLETLREYDAPAELCDPPRVGPTFVRFPIRPARGVRVRKIEGLAEEVRVRLGLEQPPFITSESGQLAVDIQRPDRQTVYFSQVRDQLPPVSADGCSQLVLGVDLEGRLQLADLAEPEHCHLLVAGTTGSGKSEWLRAAIAGLVLTNTAETLRLVLIDPKRHAFNDLADSPLLWEPIVYPDERDVVALLQRLADEMERRYAVMDGADSLEQHARRCGAALPRIVCVCDEYFDLVNRGRKWRARLEEQIFRLGAKARAAGIHLILATQQPSREVIRGALDSNIPSRVALKTNKAIESRMLLGEDGAAWLLGQGDMLFKDIGPPRRLQGVYVPPEERADLFGGGG